MLVKSLKQGKASTNLLLSQMPKLEGILEGDSFLAPLVEGLLGTHGDGLPSLTAKLCLSCDSCQLSSPLGHGVKSGTVTHREGREGRI